MGRLCVHTWFMDPVGWWILNHHACRIEYIQKRWLINWYTIYNKKTNNNNFKLFHKYRHPLKFVSETQTNEDGYPLYRRRAPTDGGYTTNVNVLSIDNQWVIPHSPILSHTFEAHINVETCHSVKSIKYTICKYILKRSDLATIELYNNG